MISLSASIMNPNIKDDKPTHVINLTKQVMKVEMSPYEWSHNLICIAYKDEIVVGIVKFQEEDEEMVEEIYFEIIQSFRLKTRIHCLSWSPETSLNVIPKAMVFACGAASNIYIFSSNMSGQSGEQTLIGHNSYVNALAYEPSGDLLASVSDDHTCRLWAAKERYACVTKFILKSQGVAVCWHHTEPCKLLVAESCGTLRLYNTQSQQAILSCDSNLSPLTAADWSLTNSSHIAALAAGYLLIWDVTRSSLPIDIRVAHSGGGSLLRFSPQSELHVASIGLPDKSFKVTHLNLEHPVCMGTFKLAGGLTWVHHLPYVCIGKDRSVCFWKVSTK